MHEFIIFTIGGLAAAGIYAITASGLTLTYTTTGIFNWAHGAIGMVCAFAYWQLSVGWGWPTLVSMLVCLFVVAPVIGIVIEAGVMRRLEGVSEASKLVVTLAVALMLLGVAQWIWNPTTYRALPPPLQQRHLGPRVDQDLLQRCDRIDPGPGRRHRPAAVPLPHPDGRHHAGQRRRPDAHLAQRVERDCQRPQCLDHRIHTGRIGRDPHRSNPDPVRLRSDAPYRQCLRGHRSSGVCAPFR